MKCALCMNSRVGISENGYHAICCLSEYEARECAFGDGKFFVPLKDFSITDKTSAFDVLNTLSSAYWGKQYYFEEKDGRVYSRDSGGYLTLDEAVTEFANKIGDDGSV